MAPPPDKNHQRQTHEQRQTEQDNIDGHRVVVESLVCGSIKRGLREVQQTCEANDEAVDFAKGGEAKDFGGVVAGRKVSHASESWRAGGNLRDGGVVERSVKDEQNDVGVCGPSLGNHTQHTNGRRNGDEQSQCESGASVVE